MTEVAAVVELVVFPEVVVEVVYVGVAGEVVAVVSVVIEVDADADVTFVTVEADAVLLKSALEATLEPAEVRDAAVTDADGITRPTSATELRVDSRNKVSTTLRIEPIGPALTC